MDRIDKETRSRVMATVRSKNTRLEEKLTVILNTAGLTEYIRYAQGLPGTPDIAFEKQKVAVFLDSCFWHGCPKHLRRPSSNTEYWQAKIERNIKRDCRQRAALRRLGWSVMRVWEHDLKKPEKITKRIYQVLVKATYRATQKSV
jgi:DNA mismatch endonuclease (patch repair protein)